jgi:hypothetical protein
MRNFAELGMSYNLLDKEGFFFNNKRNDGGRRVLNGF